MKTFDHLLSFLLMLGGVGHTAGSFVGYRHQPDVLLWSLCASLFIFLLGAVNLIRAGRRADRPLGWVTLLFNLCWLVAGLRFGQIIHNLLDPRVVGFALITLLLSAMSLRTIAQKP